MELLEDRNLLASAGDANRDFQFDTGDLVRVLQSGKYETGEFATWGEGDWTGDGVFGTSDLVAALQTGTYETGRIPDPPVDYEMKAYYRERIFSGQLSERDVEDELENLGYDELAFIEFTTLNSVKRFAPLLGFDRAAAANGYPMSAEDYFTNVLEPVTGVDTTGNPTITWQPRGDAWDGPPVDPERGIKSLCGRDECTRGMQNQDFGTLQNGSVPTYYQVIRNVATGRLRIRYWWYYGFQEDASPVKEGPDGAHHGDWEHIIVTTSPDRDTITNVTYAQHGGWYTRQDIQSHAPTGQPLVFVGKKAHGSYHDRCQSPQCTDPFEYTYFGDFRNPTDNDWWDTSMNLVSLMGTAESWMLADRINGTYTWSGQDYTITPAWRWGPHISYCNVWFFGCLDWEHTNAVGTHPTTRSFTWDQASCDDTGCDRDQGWSELDPMVEQATGFQIRWNGNDGDFFDPTPPTDGARVPDNLALAANGATAFSSSDLGPQIGASHHVKDNVNDGFYGNSNSWIGGDNNPYPVAFVGVALAEPVSITSIAWGRDNGNGALDDSFAGTDACGGQCDDRWIGSYTLQFTRVDEPNANTVYTGEADTGWQTIGTLSYDSRRENFTPFLRHEYEVRRNGTGIWATGVRLLVPATGFQYGTAIDELEVYGIPPLRMLMEPEVALAVDLIFAADGEDAEQGCAFVP